MNAGLEALRPLHNLGDFEQKLLDRILLAGGVAGLVAGVVVGLILAVVVARIRSEP